MKWRMILLLCASAQMAFAGSYKKWVDGDGKIHYGDQAPRGAVVEKVQMESEISETRSSTSVEQMSRRGPKGFAYLGRACLR